MDQSPFKQGVFPLSLQKTIRLIGSLVYLQLLYAISYLTQPFASSRRDFPPFNKAIDDTESRISSAILGVVPLTAYSSATATQRLWRLSSGNGILNYTEPALVIPVPDLGTVQSDPDVSSKILESPKPIHARTGSSFYGAMQNMKSSTRGSIASITSSAKAIFHQAGRSQNLSPPRNSVSSPSELREAQEKPAEPAEPMPAAFTENIPFPVPAICVTRGDHFSDPGPSAPLNKGKMPEVASFGGESPETVQMNRSRKYHSIESYPGRFPVSDALDYSSLATAYAVRGRGTTSVRPFSDY